MAENEDDMNTWSDIVRTRDQGDFVALLHTPQVLKVDVGGQPLAWVDIEAVAGYHVGRKIAWTLGEPMLTLRGGTNASGRRSRLDVHPIVAVRRERIGHTPPGVPSLSRRLLFRRDGNVCAYCVRRFADGNLTIEHVVPVSRGGRTTWLNCVSACRACNGAKGDRLPEEAGMTLAYVPFAPSHAEALILHNRRIIADQMAFLHAHLPKRRR